MCLRPAWCEVGYNYGPARPQIDHNFVISIRRGHLHLAF